MTDAPEMLPCPFCGSDNVKSGGDDKIVGVWCQNCEASGPNGYLTINGEHDWNTRSDLAPPVRVRLLEILQDLKCKDNTQHPEDIAFDQGVEAAISQVRAMIE